MKNDAGKLHRNEKRPLYGRKVQQSFFVSAEHIEPAA